MLDVRRFDEASELLARVVSAEPESSRAWCLMARAHLGADRYADAVTDALGWRPVPGRFHLFTVDVTDITVIRYDDATGDQFVARWPDGHEFVRRGTSATSVGEPEPHHDLLRSTRC